MTRRGQEREKFGKNLTIIHHSTAIVGRGGAKNTKTKQLGLLHHENSPALKIHAGIFQTYLVERPNNRDLDPTIRLRSDIG